MKYACGNEPMVGDTVVVRCGVGATHLRNGEFCKVYRVGRGAYSIYTKCDWWFAHRFELVRRALLDIPFLDGSGVFHTEKPKHRYPRRWKPIFSVGDYWEQLHEGGDVLYHFRNMVSGTGWTVEELEREREETFDHHAKPDTRFDEGGMYRSASEPKPTIEQLAKRVDEINMRLAAVEKQNNSYFGSKPTEWQK